MRQVTELRATLDAGQTERRALDAETIRLRYARHDVIFKSACLWLEDVNSFQFRQQCEALQAQASANSSHGNSSHLELRLKEARPLLFNLLCIRTGILRIVHIR